MACRSQEPGAGGGGELSGSDHLDACNSLPPLRHTHPARAESFDAKRDVETACLRVDLHRRQLDEAMRLEGPPEVDRLSARPDEWKL